MSRLELLVDLASMLAREVDFDALLGAACERLAAAMHADRATVWLVDAERGDLVTRVAVLPEVEALRQPIARGIAGHVARTGQLVRVDDAAHDARFDATADKATGYTTRSMIVAPIREDEHAPVRGVVQVLNRRGEADDAAHGPFHVEDERYLAALATQLGRALRMTTLRGNDGPGLVLRGPFNRIVGRSPALSDAYERVALAAQTDATVLLRGETGTGKGLFARAIHVNSARQSRPFVVVDCTTLPSQLVESELFGHERGAFTGADRRVPGRIELAEGGTLFLDELGDLPADIQGKLLRFLQDRVYERVGGRQTIASDVRVVCATHRDLEDEVKKGRFRQDLYYRVRVVEIGLPPLRARGPDEIESLARHFAERFATRYARPSPTFDADALRSLREHGFPGNVRELEHWIESAIALSPDGRVRASAFPSVARASRPPRDPASAEALDGSTAGDAASGSTSNAPAIDIPASDTLEQATARFVRAVLARSGGNKTLAAKKLGIGRNTLARHLVAKAGRGAT